MFFDRPWIWFQILFKNNLIIFMAPRDLLYALRFIVLLPE